MKRQELLNRSISLDSATRGFVDEKARGDNPHSDDEIPVLQRRIKPHRPLLLSFKALLWIYLVIPASLVIVCLDIFLWSGWLQKTLPVNPEDLRFLALFIVLPHIIASAVTFLDREYVVFYRMHLLVSIPLVLFLAVGLPNWAGADVGFAVYALYTVFHVMAQQVGITTLMVGKPELNFKAWKWFAIVAAAILYFLIFALPQWWKSLSISVDPALYILIACIIGLFFFGARAASLSRTRVGKQYLWANNIMILAAAICYFLGYQFFAILIPRLIHDLSGFAFYVIHDHNRNLSRSNNCFYALFRFTGVPLVILTPLLGIVIANLLTEFRTHLLSDAILMLAFFHYYTEGFMWKRHSLHRKAITLPSPVA
jgi:hypothetical protein